MTFRTIIISIVLILISINTKAQNYELGKVTIAELEEKVHPRDSSAAAAMLFNKGQVIIYDQGYSESFMQVKIKVYKKEGYYWSNFQLGVQPGKEYNVIITDAYTYNLVGGKIVKTNLKPEGEFIEKTNQYYWNKKIVMPDVREGSIIEFHCKVYGEPLYIRDWSFQKSIPVNYSEFKTTIPDKFIFKKSFKGFFVPKVKSVTAKTYGTTAMETTYSEENLPAMKEESFVNNINNYTSGVSFEMEGINVPGIFSKSLSGDWNSVTKTIYEMEKFGLELKKTSYFEDDLKQIILEKKSSDEKITAILNYVQTNIKWNGYNSYACNEGVRKAYQQKKGNTAEINLMLTAMLRYAGLTANPVLVSTRENGIALFPNLAAFNYVIAAVETPNGNVLLDATDKFSMPNVLPLRAINWHGRLIRKSGSSEEVDLIPKKLSESITSMSYVINQDGQISGKARKQMYDHNAVKFRNDSDGVKQDEYLEKCENTNTIEISDYSRTNEKETLLPAVETFSFAGKDLVEIIAGKMYLNPMLFFAKSSNPFIQENREYPVDFGFPFSERYTINIQIPDGFEVESFPATSGVNMQDNLGIFKFVSVVNEGQIQLSILHQINDAIVPAEKYEMLKEYYKAMIAKETEKIVLKKI
ncbi:DUF3857 domain-containing protein [Flavobacterium pectinovorum]|uniref:DUF3857 domain-containing protein n=1 Tax=Flavobacterium pectinovorum TaxID=29533 RepID=UPI001FAC3C5C|nr:DUF3857 domain-containing protein [Flavobacterium pectinovorum]MCI9844147.1 DUF3857 domain-containing protein [Flavobacterium pectinovorum]